jgi:hypothetical protein
MQPNPEWNYGYLTAYGVSAEPVSGTIQAVSGAVSAVAGVGTAVVQYKTAREQIKADERMYRMQMLQSQRDAASSTQMAKVSLIQGKQQSDAQAKIAKTVVLGLGAVAVLGGLLWIGKDLLKD